MSASGNFEQVLGDAVEVLDGETVPYMLIGGLALAAWGLPRATLDIDLTLWTEAEFFGPLCEILIAQFVSRTENPLPFALRTRVLPVIHKNVRIDFVFAAYPFEKKMIERAQPRAIGDLHVKVATLEDLILLKLPSPRPKDREDIVSILEAYRRLLDWEYLSGIGEMLSEALEAPALRTFLELERRRPA